MAVVINWNGDIISPRDTSKEWSTKGGVFNSSKRIKTYFPLPSSYRHAISVVGTHVVTAEEENRPDLLAKRLYNSEDYWWLIYWMNGVTDPFSGPKTNDIILIANINEVTDILG